MFTRAFQQLSSPFARQTRVNSFLPLSSVSPHAYASPLASSGPLFAWSTASFSTVPPLGDFDSPDYPGMYRLSFKNKKEGFLPDVPIENPSEMFNDRPIPNIMERMFQVFSDERMIDNWSYYAFESCKNAAMHRGWYLEGLVPPNFVTFHMLICFHVWMLHVRVIHERAKIEIQKQPELVEQYQLQQILDVSSNKDENRDRQGNKSTKRKGVNTTSSTTSTSGEIPVKTEQSYPSLSEDLLLLFDEKVYDRFWEDSVPRIVDAGVHSSLYLSHLKKVQTKSFNMMTELDQALHLNSFELTSTAIKRILLKYIYTPSNFTDDQVGVGEEQRIPPTSPFSMKAKEEGEKEEGKEEEGRGKTGKENQMKENRDTQYGIFHPSVPQATPPSYLLNDVVEHLANELNDVLSLPMPALVTGRFDFSPPSFPPLTPKLEKKFNLAERHRVMENLAYLTRLPTGWKEDLSTDGRRYYYREDTREVVEVKPTS